jgi:hypothetical protein
VQETELRIQNGGDKKSKIELVTIYHFSKMLRRNRGSPLLAGLNSALNGGAGLSSAGKKGQSKMAKK